MLSRFGGSAVRQAEQLVCVVDSVCDGSAGEAGGPEFAVQMCDLVAPVPVVVVDFADADAVVGGGESLPSKPVVCCRGVPYAIRAARRRQLDRRSSVCLPKPPGSPPQ